MDPTMAILARDYPPEAAIKDCIKELRSEIFDIESQQITMIHSLLAIVRCAKVAAENRPSLPAEAGVKEYTILGQAEAYLDWFSKKLGQHYALKYRKPDPLSKSKLQPIMIHPELMSEEERIIDHPKCMEIELPSKSRTQSDIELGMLIVKKAELEEEIKEVAEFIEIWSGIWEEVGKEDNVAIAHVIRRKSVPIADMLVRTKTHSEERKDSGVNMGEDKLFKALLDDVRGGPSVLELGKNVW